MEIGAAVNISKVPSPIAVVAVTFADPARDEHGKGALAAHPGT
jgi:hypothetical protein